MSLYNYSEGCFRLQGRTLARDAIEGLIVVAQKSPLRRARICVHADANDPLQEMFVLMMKDSPKGTYRYKRASSKLLIYGSMDVEFITDGGEVIERVSINDETPFIKIEAGQYHRPIITSDYILLHESHIGPWEKDFTEQWTLRGAARIEYERKMGFNG